MLYVNDIIDINMDCGIGLVMQSVRLNTNQTQSRQWYWESLCVDPTHAGLVEPTSCQTFESAKHIAEKANDGFLAIRNLEHQDFECQAGSALKSFTFRKDGEDGRGNPYVKVVYECCNLQLSSLVDEEWIWHYPGEMKILQPKLHELTALPHCP
jgi:hypothetical protein